MGNRVVERNRGLVGRAVEVFLRGSPQYRGVRDDLLAEGFFALVRSARKYDLTRAKFSTFATAAVQHAILNYVANRHPIIRTPREGKLFGEDRSRARRVVSLTPECGNIPVPHAPEQPEYGPLRAAVAKLNPRHHRVVTLRLAGEPYHAIARKLGLTTEGARVRYFGALKTLRRLLQKEYGS